MTLSNKILLYTAVLRPILSYASPVWGYAANTNIKILQVAQNSLIRSIVRPGRYEVLGPVDPRDVICTKTRLRTPSTDSRQEDHHIVRNARVQHTASSAAIQAQVAPSLGAPVPSQDIRMRLAEGHLGLRHPLRVLTPTHRHLRLEWCRARGNWIAAKWNQIVFSDESRFNLSSNDNRVRVWRTLVNTSILPLLYSDTSLPQLV
ncbi:transposable element Tcb2 transposase [Trichonephila clavipes]|nr:transposable element Tcb2 transposase [Trichonephila clavipes]